MLRVTRRATAFVITAAVVIAGLMGAPLTAQAASGNLDCTVDKSAVFSGEQVTVSAYVDVAAGDSVVLRIKDPRGSTLAATLEKSGPARVTVAVTSSVTSTSTFTCEATSGTTSVSVATPGAVRVDVVADPSVDCKVQSSAGLSGPLYVGDEVNALAEIKRPSGTTASVTITQNGAGIIASSSTDYVASPVIQLTGPTTFECEATLTIASTGASRSVTQSVAENPLSVPAKPVGTVSYGAIMNQGGQAFEAVTWTTLPTPTPSTGWDLGWTDPRTGAVNPPTSIRCGTSQDLRPTLSRPNNTTFLAGDYVTATANCTLPRAQANGAHISSGTLSGNVTFASSVPAGTEIVAEYTVNGQSPKTAVVGRMSQDGTGGSWSLALVPVPLDVTYRLRARLGSVEGAWSTDAPVPGEAPTLAYNPIVAKQGVAIANAKPVSNASLKNIATMGGRFSSKGLPRGLIIDPATGVISGTSNQVASGVATVTLACNGNCFAPVTAKVAYGTSAAAAATAAAAAAGVGAGTSSVANPTMTSGATTGGTGASSGSSVVGRCDAPAGQVYPDIHGSVGATLTYAPNLTVAVPGSRFTIVAGSLPRGVWLDRDAGVISGTPEVAGTSQATIAVTSPAGSREDVVVPFYVDDPHHAANYPNRIEGSVGSPVTITPFEVNSHGETTFELVCGSLPTGMQLDAATGVISGTPTSVDLTPAPLRVRMSDDYGAVDSSFIFTTQTGQIPWLRYPEYSEIGSGLTTTITPTVSAVPSLAAFEIDGDLPEGLSFDPRTGVISGIAAIRDNIVYEPTITALDASGQPLTSTWASITVIKPAVPMNVKARPASKKVTAKQTTVVTKVRHPKYTRLVADVDCTGCTWSFNKTSGKLTVKGAKKKSLVSVRITALPKTAKAKRDYAGHEWFRTWQVR